MMSGSRNRLRRNGSTASRESGPPSWNSTIPTRFFICFLAAPDRRAGDLFLLENRLLQPLDFTAQIAAALHDAHEKQKKYSPTDHVRRKNAVQVLHRASASRCKSSTSCLVFARKYRSAIRNAASTCIASTLKKKTFFITGSSPEPEPPIITGAGCCVRHQRIAPKTIGTSMNAN